MSGVFSGLVTRQEQQLSLKKKNTKTPVLGVFFLWWPVEMGFTQTQWLGLVLLFSCGNLCVAFNRWTNETESGTEQVTVSVQSNQTEPIQKFPVRYRLRSYQLRRNPKPSVIPQASEVREPQQEVKGSVVKALIPGPDLNPPVKQEPKVNWSFFFFFHLLHLRLCKNKPFG